MKKSPPLFPCEIQIQTPLGLFYLRGNEDFLASAGWFNEYSNSHVTPKWATQAVDEFRAYFNKSLNQFSIPIQPQGTEFQKEVWKQLLRIPSGETLSYQHFSERHWTKEHIRAVASAIGANPIAILIPCHRVIGTDGSLHGYAGGLWRKEKLLKLEGVLDDSQLSLF